MEDIKEKMPADNVEYRSHGSDDVEAQPASGGLTRALQGRHMQMIAIGMDLSKMSRICDRITVLTADVQVVPSVLVSLWGREAHFKPVDRPVWYV